MPDLHARLLAEIERREDVARQASYLDKPWAKRELAYLAALRKVVELHARVPCDDAEHPHDATCDECLDEFPCPTVAAIAEGLGVET